MTILLTNVVVLCMSASILGEFTFMRTAQLCACACHTVECCCVCDFVHFSFFVRFLFAFFSLDFLTGENESRQNNGDSGSKNCICNDNQCICCLDFNISFIDLGGPGELG